MSNSHVASLSLNPSSISDFTGTNVSEGMQRALVNNAMRQLGSMVKADFAANTGTITSASTLSLASISTGDYIVLTASGGSSSISSFGNGLEGLSKRIEAIGSIVLRASANMLTPAGADLSISTGDVIDVRSMGSTVWKITHKPYSGLPNALINAASATASESTKLLVLSGSTIQTNLVSDIMALSSPSYMTKTANYSASAGDNFAVINFTASNFTLNLPPAASLPQGFTLTVMNTDTVNTRITINPDGAETIDGLATRSMSTNDRVKIFSTGTAWVTIEGSYSAYLDQNYAVSSALSLTHLLGFAPHPEDVGAALVCINAAGALGYAQNEVVSLGPGRALQSGGTASAAMKIDATNITFITGAALIQIARGDTGASAAITAADWNLRLSARVFR